MRVDVIASLQARAPMEYVVPMRDPASRRVAVAAPAESNGSSRAGFQRPDLQKRPGAPMEAPVDFGPPDRDGNGWIDPPAPQELGVHVNVLA